ncbi:hypothetical protein BWI17_02330 [Betaproteobacteria bacterium GR16-43]|nr:hypothetical protein BWI17_02330 [Betaproteobacteria bacterium GR16-43]
MKTITRLAAALALLACLPAASQVFGSRVTKERIQTAIAATYASGTDSRNRTCVTLPYLNKRYKGRGESAFGWTPLAFAAQMDAPHLGEYPPQLDALFKLLARAGFVEPIEPAANGAAQYGLTWKGYAASGESECFRISSHEYDVDVKSFESVAPREGASIYRAMATAVPRHIDDWVKDPEFTKFYPESAKYVLGFRTPVAYDLAHVDGHLSVIRIPGALDTSPPKPRPLWARNEHEGPAATVPKGLPDLTPSTALPIIREYLQTERGANVARMCLWFPFPAIDENNLEEARKRPEGAAFPTLYFTVRSRDRDDSDQRTSFEWFRRLEAAGLATSRRVERGGVRFDLTPAGMAIVDKNRYCLHVGNRAVEEVLWVAPLSAANLTPKFALRMSFTPAPGAEVFVAKFPLLTRLKEVGVAAHGEFAVSRAGELLPNVIPQFLRFQPDPATLPEIR